MSTQPNETPAPQWQKDAAEAAATAIGRITVAAPDQDFPSYEAYRNELRSRILLFIAHYAPQPTDTSKTDADHAGNQSGVFADKQWHRITPENSPQFPCWLWSSTHEEWQRWMRNDAEELEEPYRYYAFTHWHPDQPTAPTAQPERIYTMDEQVAALKKHIASGKLFGSDADGKIAAQPSAEPAATWTPDAGATPRTDELCRILPYEDRYEVGRRLTSFARQLERELAFMRESRDAANNLRVSAEQYATDFRAERDALRAQLTARDGVIAELRGLLVQGMALMPVTDAQGDIRQTSLKWVQQARARLATERNQEGNPKAGLWQDWGHKEGNNNDDTFAPGE